MSRLFGVELWWPFESLWPVLLTACAAANLVGLSFPQAGIAKLPVRQLIWLASVFLLPVTAKPPVLRQTEST